MHENTLLVKCRDFVIKPDYTYNKKWVLKSLSLALVTLMYYTLQCKGHSYFAKKLFQVSCMILPKHKLHP